MNSIKKQVLSIKRKPRRNYLFLAFCFLFLNTYFLILNTSPALAQTLSLSLWPPLLEVTIQPGRTITQVYQLTNNSDTQLEITPQIYAFKPQGEKGEIKIKFPNIPQANSLSSRLNQSPESIPKFFSFGSGEEFGQSFYLSPGKTREVLLQVSAPRGTLEADYYFTLLFSTTNTPSENNPSSTLSITQIGSNILITVSQTGNLTLLGRILEFSAPKIIDSFSPATLTLRLENWGKTFWKPFGKIMITGIFKQKEEASLLEQNVLGESSRTLDIEEIKPKLPIGPFKAQVKFTLNPPSETGEEKNSVLSAETVFWFLPYKLVGSIIFIIIVIIATKRLNILRKQS